MHKPEELVGIFLFGVLFGIAFTISVLMLTEVGAYYLTIKHLLL